MKKNILNKKTCVLLVCMILITSAFGKKNKSTMDILMSGKWEMQSNYASATDTNLEKYDKRMCNSVIIKDGEEIASFSLPYYLSDSTERKFDKNKIGKNNNGKYLITLTRNLTDNALKDFTDLISADNDKEKEKTLRRDIQARSKNEINKILAHGLDSSEEYQVAVFEIISISDDELILQFVPHEDDPDNPLAIKHKPTVKKYRRHTDGK